MKKEVNKNFTKLTHRGISLIVLIVTIIVIIILAAAVILTISKNNPLKSAKEATFKSDVRGFQDDLALTVSKEYTDLQGQRDYKITTSENPKLDEMKNYIPSFTKKYEEKLGIEDDELVYFPDNVTDDEKKWLEDLGMNPYGYKIEEADIGFFDWDGSKIIGIKSDKKEELKSFVASNKGTLKIPTECTAIGDSVFKNCDFLEKVIVNDEVTSIGSSTFSSCNNLKQVKLSNNLRSIEEEAFSSCINLEKIEIPESVKSLGKRAFFVCTKLTSVNMSDNITYIGMWAFSECSNLKEINLPKKLNRIVYGTFNECSSLENITIPEEVTSIDEAFDNCTNLISVNISSSVTNIEDHAFNGCYNLSEINVSDDNQIYASEDGILFNKSKTEIIKYPFGKKNTTYEIPNTVTSIHELAFLECNTLTEVIIKEGIVDIGECAFFECRNLKNITIPKSVTSIGSSAFYGCFSLIVINCEATSKPDGWDSSWNPNNIPVNWGYTGE